jgi:hypothetical protein
MEREKGVPDLKARIERLETLAQVFAKEVDLWRGDDGLLLFREKKGYLAAVQDALAGVDAARVVLAGVVRRMERGA